MERRNFVGLSSFQFMVGARRGLFYGFLTLYMLEFLQRSFTEAMLIMALPLLANSLTQPFLWGPLSDKIGRRKIFIATGEAIAGFAYIILSPLIWEFLTGLSVLRNKAEYAYFLIFGLTILESLWSMSNVGWSALLADLTTKEERGTIAGQLNSMEAVGRIVGVFLGGIIYDYPYRAGGFKYLFYVSSIIMFVSAIIILTMVKERRISRDLQSLNEKKLVEYDSMRWFYIFLIPLMLTFTALASIRRIMTYYLRLALTATSFEMSLVINTASLTQLLANPIVGKLSDKYGRLPILKFGFLLSAIACILFTMPKNLLLLLPISMFMGVSRAILFTSSYAYVADRIPEEFRGRYFGRYNMANTISFGVVPIITAGILSDTLMRIYLKEGASILEAQELAMINVFYLSSILSLIGLIILIFYSRKYNENISKPNKIN